MSQRKSTIDRRDDEDLLVWDSEVIAQQEARNGLLQFDEVERLISVHSPEKRLDLTPETILQLNRLAIQGVRKSAGSFRHVPISITNTTHVPPPFEQVPQLVDEMCAYVNDHWNSDGDDLQSALHLSAYLMWRLNWIHPFRDGNGRTSRAISYLVLAVRLGMQLVGTMTIADQIVADKNPYYAALDAADDAWRLGGLVCSTCP